MSPVKIDVEQIVRLVREVQPITSAEVRFALQYPTPEFADNALKIASSVSGKLTEVAGYWTAVVADHPTQGG